MAMAWIALGASGTPVTHNTMITTYGWHWGFGLITCTLSEGTALSSHTDYFIFFLICIFGDWIYSYLR